MNFVVCVKQTPDTAELPKISAAEAVSGDIKATLVLNPWDEFAVEEALLLEDRFGGDVTVVRLGPEKATEALKDAIARGVKSAVLLDDPAFAGSDAWGTPPILTAAIKKNGAADVILTGKMSVDGNSGLVRSGPGPQAGGHLIDPGDQDRRYLRRQDHRGAPTGRAGDGSPPACRPWSRSARRSTAPATRASWASARPPRHLSPPGNSPTWALAPAKSAQGLPRPTGTTFASHRRAPRSRAGQGSDRRSNRCQAGRPVDGREGHLREGEPR